MSQLVGGSLFVALFLVRKANKTIIPKKRGLDGSVVSFFGPSFPGCANSQDSRG